MSFYFRKHPARVLQDTWLCCIYVAAALNLHNREFLNFLFNHTYFSFSLAGRKTKNKCNDVRCKRYRVICVLKVDR